MENIQNEFVPFEESYVLKQLGFNKPCCAIYFLEDGEFALKSIWSSRNGLSDLIDAPLWQQAFDFLRENYQLNVVIDGSGSENLYTVFCRDYIYHGNRPQVYSYPEARVIALRRMFKILLDGGNKKAELG